MSDSDWKQDFEDRVIAILRSDQFSLREAHHFGTPFVSAYQLAVAFEATHGAICQQYGKGIGSDYKGMSNLAGYIAWNLSKQISDDPDGYQVEGVWLSGNGLADLHFMYQGSVSTGSPNTKHGGFSMFRLRNRR